MPGNEVGDRIHNFLGQESLPQGQHHSQVIDGTWPGLSNNLWVGSQRQVGGPLVSSLKNFSVHQLAESDRGHSGPSSSLQHGLNFTQSALRPEIARSQSQNQSPIANGYMQGHQSFQARQNETNFLGVDTASRGLSALDSQMGNGPDLHKKNLLRLESNESPVNFDFFGGQQQISGQLPGMVQTLPRQQSGMNDMQLLQQHAMLKHMQELQRQQLQKPQFQLPEARQLSSVNQGSSVAKQGSGSLSPTPINGIPVHDSPNYSWQPEHMTTNANWLQHGASPVMQPSSSGFMFSPEQGQVRLMGLVPQQVDQSFYGISASGGRGNPYNSQYPVQMDKPLMQQGPASSNSFSGNQYAMFPDQVSLQDGTAVSRQADQGKNMLVAAAGQGLNSGFHSENLQQMIMQPKDALTHESCGRQEHPGTSEASLEKSVIQASPSQNVATLDPTEEKILYGSDDSVWDIFGKSSNVGPGMEVTDSLGAFPSLQSGSWSALMQSAVAETSSNDVCAQEEWTGLGVQNSEPPSGNVRSLVVNEGSKQLSAWADNNQQTASMLNPKPFPMSTDANINRDFCSVAGVQQSGVQTVNEQTGRVQNDLSRRFVQQLTEERSKWLDRGSLQKPVPDGAQLFGNVAQSPDMHVNAKSISGNQGITGYNACGQPHNKQNGWNFIESVSHTGGGISKSQDTDNSLLPSQKSDRRGAMCEESGHGSGLIRPASDANAESGNVSSALGSPQMNKEGSDLNNAAAMTDSNMARLIKEGSRQLQNSNNLNLWKSIDSKGNSVVNEIPAKYTQSQDKGPQTVDLSGNNGLVKGVSKTNILEHPNVKETSNDSFHSNLTPHATTGGMRDNVWVDANGLRGGKQKFVQINRKSSVTRKFQYHPMGDVDVEVEPSYATKSDSQSQHVSQGLKGHDQGNLGHSKFTGHASGQSTETEKGRFPGVQVNEVPTKSLNPGAVPDRSFGGFMPNKTVPMSQNMLELLQKVDQPREHGTATHFSSSECNQSSEMPDTETSDGSVGQFQHNRPSVSQGFGLQLGPPSQKFPDRPISSQGSPQGVSSVNTVQVSSEVGRMAHTWFGPTASGQSSIRGTSHGDIRNNYSNVSGQISNKATQYNAPGNISGGFTSDYSNLKSHLQNQHVTGLANQVTPNESVNAPFGGLQSQSKQNDDSSERAQNNQQGRKSAPHIAKTAQDNDLASSSETSWPSSSNQNHARDLGQQFPVLEAMPASQPSPESLQQGSFTKSLPNVWTRVSSPQNLVGAQSYQVSQNLFKPHPQSNPETTLPGIKKVDDHVTPAGGSGLTEFPAGPAKPRSLVGEEQAAKAQQVLPENNASQNPTTMQRDIEAFGRSLRPNNAVHQNYSLLHQVQAMKSAEIDPSNRSVKRFKGPDSGLDAQQRSSRGAEQYGSDTAMRDAPVNRPVTPSGDSKMLSFSSNTGDNRETHLSSNDILAFARSDSQHFPNGSNSAANLKGENPQISPQMAPSWFDRYGTFKNEQMLPVYDARKIAMMKAAEKPFIVGRPPSDSLQSLRSSEQVSATSDASQLDNARQSSSMMPIPELIPPHSLPPDILNQNLVIARAKKRKSMMVELLPWHREVAQGSQRPHNISVAEVEWAQSANRLIEKVEDEPEALEDWPLVLRSKRRVILTTQLMQHLLCAPPRLVLSLDASKNYETVAYFVARSALGDACSTAYTPESDNDVPSDSGSIISEKLKRSEKSGKQSILEAAEQFVIRAKKLESDIQSLDKRASILDLRVECQDLEKFSVINRFAKFHGRGQTDGAETSSSSDAMASTQKFFPQRYVTALPMPRNIPDRVQCLSL